MPVREYSSEEAANVTVTTTSETVVATVSGINTYAPGAPIRLKGFVQLTTGVGTTAITVRVRRDSVTGTVVNEANAEQIEAAAGSTEGHEILCDDSFAGEVAGQVYVLTVQQTAATGDGSALYGYLNAEVG